MGSIKGIYSQMDVLNYLTNQILTECEFDIYIWGREYLKKK
jgi:hypothetical protein